MIDAPDADSARLIRAQALTDYALGCSAQAKRTADLSEREELLREAVAADLRAHDILEGRA